MREDLVYVRDVWRPQDHSFSLAASREPRVRPDHRDTPEQALASVTPYVSGHCARVRSMSPAYLRIPALLHRLGMAASDTDTRLTVLSLTN